MICERMTEQRSSSIIADTIKDPTFKYAYIEPVDKPLVWIATEYGITTRAAQRWIKLMEIGPLRTSYAEEVKGSRAKFYSL